MPQKEYLGGVSATTLSGTITDVSASFTVATGGGSGFPDGASYPFTVVIGRGTASEEKILCASRSGDTFTVTTRGYDGTSAVAHSGGPAVEHCIDALVINEASAHVYDTSGAHAATAISFSPAGTIAASTVQAALQELDTEKSATTHTHDTAWSKTVAVQGEVKVPSGAVDYLVPFTVHVESGETLTITKVYDAIRSGTSVTYKLTKNGVDQITGISATTTHDATDVADFTVVDGDRLAVVVTAVSGTPDGLEVTICGTVGSID